MADLYATYSHLINLIGVNALLALSIYLTLSCAMLSLSNAASMGIGAYAAALLTTNLHWPLWPAVAVGALTAGAVGLLLGLPILRLRGVYLAIATIGFGEMVRALLLKSRLLLMDEPSMGLAPLLVREIFRIIAELNAAGSTILLVEQNSRRALQIAHYAYVLDRGRIALQGTGEELLHNEQVASTYLGGGTA